MLADIQANWEALEACSRKCFADRLRRGADA
jgi:hypothetical protein